MLSRSCFNLLNLDDYLRPDRTRIPRVMTVPGIISDFDSNDFSNGEKTDSQSDVVSSASQERRIIVSNQLPVKAHRDAAVGSRWCFDWDKDALYLQLKDGFPNEVEVIYIGCLKVDIDPSEQDDVSTLLFEKFRCVPTFLPPEVQNNYYHGFCKHYLWPLFHYMLPLTSGHRFDRVLWQAYVSANKIFADTIMEVINPDEDYVWIHDYHLMVLPTFFKKKV